MIYPVRALDKQRTQSTYFTLSIGNVDPDHLLQNTESDLSALFAIHLPLLNT